MKNMKRIFGVALLVVLLGCGTVWATAFNFTDASGQYWAGSANGSLSISSADIAAIFVDAADGNLDLDDYSSLYSGSSSYVHGTDQIDGSIFDSGLFTLASADGIAYVGGDISSSLGGSIAFAGGTVFYALHDVAIDLTSWTATAALDMMFFQGDPLGSYVYAGVGIDGLSFGYSDLISGFDLSSLLCGCSGGSFTFNTNGEASIDVIAGRNCSSVPIPAAIWLFGSGFLGLVGIRRRK